MDNQSPYPDKASVTLTKPIKETLQWMSNPSTSQKVPKYVQKGMDDLKKQVLSSDE